MSFEQMWQDLEPIGRDSTSGGYRRAPFAAAERECVAWYVDEAHRRGLDIEKDGQGNVVAWWSPDSGEVDRIGTADTAATTSGIADPDTSSQESRPDTSSPQSRPTQGDILIGSHLDSVDNGGAFDGPLGVVSSFAAIDALRDKGFQPQRRIGVAMFVEEEGSRFGIACLGSRLATGQLDPLQAAELRDQDGVFLLDAMAFAGVQPNLGPSALLHNVDMFVELHVEQGRDLIDRDRAIALASASWAHGRWRFDFTGEPNHAGATRMEDRHDPMLTYAMTALAANKQARLAEARATFGRVAVHPNVTNAVPEHVQAWLDARGADAELVDTLVEAISRQAGERAARDGTHVDITAESLSPTVNFDETLTLRLSQLLDGAPVIPTGAGHDAGVLQLAGIPSAMLFVRNPTGVSHSPAEHAEMTDCLAGVEALAKVLEELAA
ncbi:MAG: allantoate amidohydrolase [Nocardioidaceae bacterium]